MCDSRVAQKIKRFRLKQQLSFYEPMDEEEYFNPDYVEVDRVLDMSSTEGPDGEEVVHYLVKWRGLPYEDCTWELVQDIDKQKVLPLCMSSLFFTTSP